jgi:hypothetical protein
MTPAPSENVGSRSDTASGSSRDPSSRRAQRASASLAAARIGGPEIQPTLETTARSGGYRLVIVANRLPVDQVEAPDGGIAWRPSPGGLVAALRPVLAAHDGVWVGWTGVAGSAPGAIDSGGLTLVPLALSAEEVERYYEGMSNGTLWPLYHDVIVPPTYHRDWWDAYVKVNRRFAEAALNQAAEGATVWVQDYQLQLVPAMIREHRPDLRIGFFNHIPFPPYEIFAQLPWRRRVLEGLLGADLIGFQRPADVTNFLRACRRNGIPSNGRTVSLSDGPGQHGQPDSERDRRQGLRHPGAFGFRPGPFSPDPARPGSPGNGPARRGPARLHERHSASVAGLRGAS